LLTSAALDKSIKTTTKTMTTTKTEDGNNNNNNNNKILKSPKDNLEEPLQHVLWVKCPSSY